MTGFSFPMGDEGDCTCGLRYRWVEIQNWFEMYSAWHKRAEEAEAAPLALDELRQRIAMAFYEAEKHVPAKDGHCDKCGFVHCEVGHVLAMAHEGVLEALRDL